MSTDDINDPQASNPVNEVNDELQSSASSSPVNDLNLLGSPFAYTPAPADLIDLWDETDRFFDALGDPQQFIEPDGEPTYQVDASALALTHDHTQESLDSKKEQVKLFDLSTPPKEPKDHIHTESRQYPQVERSSDQRTHPQRINRKSEPLKEEPPPSRPSLSERFTQRHRPETKVIVIAGGKGGVGRSLLAANLSLSLAQCSGESVGIVDLDPVGANLHTYLGLDPILEMPGRTLRREVKPISQKLLKSELILTRSGRTLYGITPSEDREQTFAEALSLKPKWLVVDAGHIPDPFTLKLFSSAYFSITVYTPDPSSVERGHLFLQAALYSQLIDQGDEASVIARSLLTADHEGIVVGPRSLARSLKHVHSAACHTLEQRINHFTPHIIVNQCRTQSDRASSEMICSVLKRKWSIAPVSLGSISFHHVAHQSLIERQPLSQLFPSAPISLDIDKITRSLIKRDLALRETPSLDQDQTGARV